MIGPNLSDWSLKHRSFLAMISIVVAGLSSYFRLGRSEDPAFTFRTMIVQAAWPGATLDDTLTQSGYDEVDRQNIAQHALLRFWPGAGELKPNYALVRARIKSESEIKTLRHKVKRPTLRVPNNQNYPLAGIYSSPNKEPGPTLRCEPDLGVME